MERPFGISNSYRWTHPKGERMTEYFFSHIEESETIRIVSGEASLDIIERCEDTLWKAYDEKGATIKVLVGPVISVSGDFFGGRSRGNPYLRLAEKSALSLYTAPMRQIRHLTILGERRVLVESYHECLAPPSERESFMIDNPDVAQKCAYDFDIDLEAFQSQEIRGSFSSPKNILCLTRDEICKIKEVLTDPAIAIDLLEFNSLTYHTIMNIIQSPGRLYDFLNFDKTVTLLKYFGLFKPDMVLGTNGS